MSSWNGGISNNGYARFIARVPRPDQVAIKRTFKGANAQTLAERWQGFVGYRVWGKLWPLVKKQGRSVAVIQKRTRSKATKNILIRPGVVLLKVGSKPIHQAGKFKVSYRRVVNDEVRPSHTTFTYGTPTSKYKSKDEALSKALDLKEQYDATYNKVCTDNQLLKIY